MDCFIDMLPADKLLTIFEYLDAKTLKKVYKLAVMFEMEPFFNNEPVIENLLTVERKVKMLRDICSLYGSKIGIFASTTANLVIRETS